MQSASTRQSALTTSVTECYETIKPKFNNLKNYSLYTSISENQFLQPNELITSLHVEGIEVRAKTRYDLVNGFLVHVLKDFDKYKQMLHEIDPELVEKSSQEFIHNLINSDD